MFIREGSDDPAVNFAQLTQRAGNFLVGRQAEEDFKWQDLRGKTVLGGRAGGMPQMVFEYILKKNGLDPVNDLTIDQSISFRPHRGGIYQQCCGLYHQIQTFCHNP